jgi:REP element-mobilizing transposase RayT
MKTARQLPLSLPQHGGRRPGAGRKPKGPRPLVSHKARAQFDKPLPAHVTLRVGETVWNLRSGRSYRRLKTCLEAAAGRFGLRVIAFSIQGNHLHLIVEANDTEALSRGMQGLSIRMAKALNSMMRRSGRVFADHYHSRLLRSPSETVNAIAYVLDNHRHHQGERGVDRYSSVALDEAERAKLLSRPVGWLLRVGWRRAKWDVRRPSAAKRERSAH